MAFDELFMISEDMPTFRLYSWACPTVSLGHFQEVDDSLAAECKKHGVALVRRPTGGRAVFHDKEITYSICSPYEQFPLPHSLKGVYSTIADWLINFFKRIGIKVYLDKKWSPQKQYMKSNACFLTATPYEMLTSGKKICGSAQKRGRESFLQHGSIPIEIDANLFAKLMGLDNSRLDTFTSLGNEGCLMDIEELSDILIQEFEIALNCRLQLHEPSEAEIKAAEKLKSKFELL